MHDPDLKGSIREPEKTAYKLFDFFANCEYFEKDFKYDEVLALPKHKSETKGDRKDDRDLSLIVISERLNISAIATLDSDFDIYRRYRKQSFERVIF